MLYREFGKTGEKVSILGFGCMRLPLLPGGDTTQIDEARSIEMIRYAIDRGVNYIDTAWPYHGNGRIEGGESEPLVAKALKEGYREKVKLATKLPTWLIQTREQMDFYLNEQLKRLETDTIDFYLIHNINKHVWTTLKEAGLKDFMDSVLEDGRVKYIGFSFHDELALFKEIVDYYDWSFCQIQYNYLDETYQAGKEGLEYAAARNLGVTIMEPLRGGKLAANLPEKAQALVDAFPVKRTPAEWALRWVWNHPEVSVVLSGMNTLEQVVENLKTAEKAAPQSLTPEEDALLDQVKGIYKSLSKVNCTACGYCLPCPVEVNIPGCFAQYNQYFMFGLADAYAGMPEKRKASNCVACGRCVAHCPQNIQIPEELAKVAALLG